MSNRSCSHCGAAIDASDAEQPYCARCRGPAGIAPRRGEREGVRVDPGRLEAALPSRERGPVDEPRGEAKNGSRAATGTAQETGPRKPPVLASEALLREIAPPTPAATAVRVCAAGIGGLGVLLVWLVAGARGPSLPLLGMFAALAFLALPRMPYVARAAALVTVAASGLALALVAARGILRDETAVPSAGAVVLLATALFFRAWHRDSTLARALVALGMLACAALLFGLAAKLGAPSRASDWQTWLPALLLLPLGLVLMLALLAFMDARSTGAATAWASWLLAWYASYSVVAVLRRSWPVGARAPSFERAPIEVTLVGISSPLLVTIVALATAQLLAAARARGVANTRAQRPT